MDIFAGSDCAVYSLKPDKSSAYKIEGSALSILTETLGDGTLVQIADVQVDDQDIALPVVATDNVRVLFKFGRDFGSVNIIGRIYRGALSGSCANYDVVMRIKDAFDEARLSATSNPTIVSVAGANGYPVYPIHFKLSDAQGETNSIGFVIGCILAPDPEGK